MSKDKITGNPNLLSESTVRRFMTLARLEPLGNSFIEENFNQEELEETAITGDEATSEIQEEVEELEEMGGYGAREDEESPAEEEMEAEPEAAAPAAEDVTAFATAVATALADAIEAASNGKVSVSVEGGDEPEMDMEPSEPGLPEEPEMEELPEEEPEEEVADLEEETELELSLDENDREEIVQEVYNRIAKKLLAAKLTNK